MERGWELAAELAQLRYQQSQLERSTRQQDERLQRDGGEGGDGEGGRWPRVRLSRPESALHVVDQLQVIDAATKALREEITAFDAQVHREGGERER